MEYKPLKAGDKIIITFNNGDTSTLFFLAFKASFITVTHNGIDVYYYNQNQIKKIKVMR